VEKVVYWVDIDGKAILRIDAQTGDRQVFSRA
jgi:sugar lactone lactonase YvrE